MKNNDIPIIQKIIEYCDIVDILLDEYERDYQLFNPQNHFNYLQVCV